MRELVAELTAELEQGDELHENARAELLALRDAIDASLRGETPPEVVPSQTARSLVTKFEAEHPDLTALTQRLANALAAIGL